MRHFVAAASAGLGGEEEEVIKRTKNPQTDLSPCKNFECDYVFRIKRKEIPRNMGNTL